MTYTRQRPPVPWACGLGVWLMLLLGHAGSSLGSDVQVIRSPDGETTAWTVALGEPARLLTEIWVDQADTSGAERIRSFLGAPGGLHFLPGGRELVYLQHGLRYTAFDWSFIGKRDVPLIQSRIWRVRIDGSGERVWPLPSDIHPDGIEVAGEGDWLIVQGPQGDLPGRGDRGTWMVDLKGKVTRLEPDDEAENEAQALAGVEHRISTDQRTGSRVPEGRRQALNVIRRTLDVFEKGYERMLEGNSRSASRLFDGAHETLSDIRKMDPGPGLAKLDLKDHLQAIHGWADMPDGAFEQAVTLDRFRAMGGLIDRFRRVHDGRDPGDLEAAYTWVNGALEKETDREVVEWIFASRPDPDLRHVSGFLYRPGAPAGEPTLSCYTRVGKVSYLMNDEDGWHAETTDLGPGAVDSLESIASGLSDEGDPRKALPFLEAAAHQRPGEVGVHTDLGHAYLAAGFHERSAEAFKKAISRGRKREIAEAFYGLGLVHLRDGLGAPSAIARDNAIEYFREALIRNQDHIQARFERAKARYLRGDPDSMKDIEGVVKRNPQHAQACLLMGDWYANIEADFEKAIEWYRVYAEMRPDDVEGQRALAYGYLRAGKYQEILERFAGRVAENPDAYGLLPIVAQASMKQSDPERADRCYRRYLERLEPEDRGIYEDIRLVASQDETTEYEALEGDDRQAFVRRFWNRRDSDLTTPVNERLLEHYRRIWYAREQFAKKVKPWDARGDVYVRFGEPEHTSSSLEMNLFMDQEVQKIKERMAIDMYGVAGVGETYVGPVFPIRSRVLEERQYGADERAERTSDGRMIKSQLSGTPSLQSMGFNDMYGKGGETSRNTYGGPTQDEQAIQEEGQEEGETQIVDRFEREEISFLFESNQYHPVTLAGGFSARVPWESWVYTGIGQGVEITFTDEMLGGVYDFAPMPTFSANYKRDVSLRQMARFSRHVPKTVFEREVSARPDYYLPRYDVEPIDFWFDHADFRGRDGRSALEIYCGVPNEVAHYADSTDVTRMTVRRRVALMPAEGDTIYRASAEVFYQKVGDHRNRNAFVPDVVRLELPPGAYQMEVRGEDEVRDRMGIYRKMVNVEAYPADSLRISDLELAWRISEEQELERFRKGNLEVIPMPTRSFLEGQPVSVYYEIYNLTRDAFGQARYKVEYTILTLVGGDRGGIASRLVHSFTGDDSEQVAIRYEQTGLDETQVAYVELDVAESGPGRYELRVEVTDLQSGEAARKETWFVISE